MDLASRVQWGINFFFLFRPSIIPCFQFSVISLSMFHNFFVYLFDFCSIPVQLTLYNTSTVRKEYLMSIVKSLISFVTTIFILWTHNLVKFSTKHIQSLFDIHTSCIQCAYAHSSQLNLMLLKYTNAMLALFLYTCTPKMLQNNASVFDFHACLIRSPFGLMN